MFLEFWPYTQLAFKAVYIPEPGMLALVQYLVFILVSLFYKKEVECHKTRFFMNSGGDLGESESVKLYSSGNWGVKKWLGPRKTGIFRVPHGIPISPEEFFLKCKFVQCT